jgi:hypothetical protein
MYGIAWAETMKVGLVHHLTMHGIDKGETHESRFVG